MKTKLLKKLLPILLSILIIGTSIPLQVFASTSSATKINSQTLFEASTLDTLELNIKTLPTITVTGSEKYQINNSAKTRPVYKDEITNSNVIFDCGFDKKLDATINVKFSNCGTLNGKAIDMKVIYSDIYSAPEQSTASHNTKTFWWTAYGTPSQQTDSNEWFEVGFSRFNVDISFYYHNSNKPIMLKNAYFTLYSEDGVTEEDGSVIYSEVSSSAGVASNVFLYENTSIAYKASVTHFKKNYKDVYYGTSRGSTTAKTKNAISYQYKNRESINCDMMMMYSYRTMGYHFNFVPLTACVPDEPIKTVSKETATGNTNFEYSIKQTLPTAYDKNFKLKSLKLVDILEKPIDYVSAKVFDEKGKDITKTAGTLSYDENTKKVMFEFNADYLKGISYNGQTVTMKINVVTKENISVKEINNKSISNFNDTDVLYSNTVQTNIYYPVTVNYLDEQGNKLAESSTKDYFVGDTYSTKSKTISKYVLIETPSNADGTVINSAITVDYIYRLKDANVIVNYIDTEGNPLAESDTINGKVFDEYTTETKNIYGYELTAIPENANGTMTNEGIIVNYIYSQNESTVTINYLEKDTDTKLATTVIYKYLQGSEYDVNNETDKSIQYYKIVSVRGDEVKGIVDGDKIINVYYDKKKSNIVINFIDWVTKEVISPLINKTQEQGTDYDVTTDATKEIEYYTYYNSEGNVSGVLEQDENINSYYVRNENNITIKYVEKGTDKELANTVTQRVHQGTDYNVSNLANKEIDCYNLDSIEGLTKGFITEDIEIIVYYTTKATDVVVKYVDTEGKALTKKTVIDGKVFDNYTTENKTFYGYELTEMPDNANGTMTENTITVIYVYRLKDTSVVVNYKTETGDKLADSITLDGKVFDKYNTEQMDFYGYELIAVPDNATGEMSEDIITVDYIYRLKNTNVIVNYIDTEGKSLAESDLITGKVFDEYITEAKNIYGYELTAVPDNATGEMTEDEIVVDYIYSLKLASVIVNYKTETGDKLADSITFDGKVFDKYNTEQMEFYGYELIAVPENATGEMSEDVITVDYIYRLKDAKVIVKYVDTENKELEKSIIIEGKVFDEYVTEQKDIKDYSFVKATPNIAGTMTEDTIEVIYTYTRTILNEIKVIETEKPVEQTNKDTPVEIEIVDTGDTNNTIKLSVMGGLLVVFIIIFVLVSKKMKKK